MRLSMQQCDGDQLEWTMKLTGYGYGEQMIDLLSGKMRVNGNRVEIERTGVRDQGPAIPDP